MVFVNVEPVVWKPQNEGEQIEGVLIGKQEKMPGEMSARYFLENKEGQHLVWGSTVLDDRMATIKVGDIIRITFKGVVKNKRKQDVKIFSVEVNK